MGWACGKLGGGEIHARVLLRKPERKENLEALGMYGRKILKCIFKKYDGSMDWMDVAQEWDRWRALVSAVMNIWVTYNAGNFLTS
jgi:hypothetical protein